MEGFIVESGVKGAYRINRRLFTGENAQADAEARAERIRRSNSTGDYWAEVYPISEHRPCLDQHCDVCSLLALDAEMKYRQEHPYAGACGEADALADRIAESRAELESAGGFYGVSRHTGY